MNVGKTVPVEMDITAVEFVIECILRASPTRLATPDYVTTVITRFAEVRREILNKKDF